MSYLYNSLLILLKSKDDQPHKGILHEFFMLIFIKMIWRIMSHFLPGNAETIIDYDCVPTYSQSLAAQIINMDDNVIVSQTSLKSGMIATVIFYVTKNMLIRDRRT